MKRGASKWEKHVPFIKAHAGKLTRAEIAARIGTTKSNLYNITRYFNITLPSEQCGGRPRGSKWQKHLPYIREMSGVLPRAAIAEHLGISSDHLRNLCYRFDIPAPPVSVGSVPCVGTFADPFAGNIPRGGHRYVGR